MYFQIAKKYLQNKPSRTLLTILAIMIAIGSLTIFSALHSGLKEYLFNDSTNPLNRLTVQPKGQISGYFNPINAFKPVNLTDSDLEKIAKIPHVTTVSPQGSIKGMSSLQVNLFGQWFQTDALIFSLPHHIIVDSKIDQNDWENYDENNIPVIISTLLVDLYNFSFASVNNLPRLNEKNFIGTELRILVNQSTFFASNNQEPIVIKAYVAGFSNQAKLIGATIPPQALEKITNNYLNEENINYLNAIVDIDSINNLELVKSEIEKLGLQANSTDQNLNGLQNYFQIFSLAFSMINLIILFITGLMIANTFLANTNERIKDIGILRTLGITKNNLRKIFLYEAATLGFAGGLLGFFTAYLIGTISNYLLQENLKDLNTKPEIFFAFDIGLFLFVVSFSIVFCIIFSFLPADKASKQNPVQALNN